MQMSADDSRTINQQKRRLAQLAEAVQSAQDTDAIAKAAWALRTAAVDTYQLAVAVEDATRAAAIREHEAWAERQVGMEPEHL